MREIDFEYIANQISSLTRIPIRVYIDNEPVLYSDGAHFPKDPATPFLESLMSIEQAVSYYITPYEQFYGIINCSNVRFIIGPTYQMAPSREKIREFMFLLDLKENYMELYQRLMQNITPMPLELFLRELCLIYYFISEEKIELSDISVIKSDEPSLTFDDDAYSEEHTTYEFETRMLNLVKNGDMNGLLELVKNSSTGRPGKVAKTYLRQLKNIFISTATLVSRAAILGGLPTEEALSLSDRYIQHCENHTEPEQIMNLQYHMVLDYTSLVAKLKNGTEYNKFLRTVTGYIREHLSDKITVEQMAKDLFISRSYLSTRFKKETGETLSSYIQRQQIERAKEYLKNTSKSILEISTCLGFSSQGYFQNVFKKHTGMTPKDFRDA